RLDIRDLRHSMPEFSTALTCLCKWSVRSIETPSTPPSALRLDMQWLLIPLLRGSQLVTVLWLKTQTSITAEHWLQTFSNNNREKQNRGDFHPPLFLSFRLTPPHTSNPSYDSNRK